MSTLHSLSADGGVVAAMDLVIIKVGLTCLRCICLLTKLVKTHAIAFLQFIESEDGQKHREGPWNEAEENRINERWKVDSVLFEESMKLTM